MIFRSIKTQLQLWHCAFPSLIFILLLVVFYQHQKRILTREGELELKTGIIALLPFAHEVVSSVNLERAAPIDQNRTTTESLPNPDSTLSAIIDGGYFVRIFSPDKTLLWKSTNSPELGAPEISSEIARTAILSYEGFQEAVYVAPQSFIVAVGNPNDGLSQKLKQLRIQIIVLAATLITMGWTGGYFITKRAIRPIETISQTARSISSGKRGQRINVDKTKNELGTLAEVLNESFERQDAAFEQQVQFLADASHELRTPISIILAKSQLGQIHTDPERSNSALETCENAAKQMRILIESLLDLSRLDSGAFELNKTKGDLAETAQDAVNFIRPLVDEKGLTVETNLTTALGEYDEPRIRQVFINILTNAIKYNKPDNGWIKVSEKIESEQFQVTVQNCGKTIPSEDLPHLFNRFYRVDKSRTRSNEGSAGLGLAITKAIVEAHGGSISATSADGVTEFTVTLPLA